MNETITLQDGQVVVDLSEIARLRLRNGPFKWFKGPVTLHAGSDSNFLIDCARLRKNDLTALAHLGKRLVGPYGRVEGIPRGGIAFAEELDKLKDSMSDRMIVVDDVWTTGTCMRAALAKYPAARGLVIFARGPVWDVNVKAIFRLHTDLEAV